MLRRILAGTALAGAALIPALSAAPAQAAQATGFSGPAFNCVRVFPNLPRLTGIRCLGPEGRFFNAVVQDRFRSFRCAEVRSFAPRIVFGFGCRPRFGIDGPEDAVG